MNLQGIFTQAWIEGVVTHPLFETLAPYVVVVALILALTLPLILGKGGVLAESATENNPEKLENRKKMILKAYLEEEAAFKAGDILKASWNQRREYLVHRYVDIVRRLDYVTSRKPR